MVSPSANSVTAVGVPPAEEMRESPPCVRSAAMIFPSSPQAPDAKFSALQRTTGAPPWTGIFRSLPFPKKAIHWPSGEKKGEAGPQYQESA